MKKFTYTIHPSTGGKFYSESKSYHGFDMSKYETFSIEEIERMDTTLDQLNPTWDTNNPASGRHEAHIIETSLKSMINRGGNVRFYSGDIPNQFGGVV